MANRLNAVTPRQYVDGNGESRTAYTTIGSAFETKNGWAIRLDALPAPSLGKSGQIETTILLLPPKDNDRQQASQSRRAPAPASEDDIPFAPEWR